MEVLDALLSPEFLAGVLIVGAFIMGIRSTLGFGREAAALRPRLEEVERELKRIRAVADERRQVVDELNKVVAPISAREAQLRSYYEELQQILIDTERQEQLAIEQKEAERRKRVQRQKMGMGEGSA